MQHWVASLGPPVLFLLVLLQQAGVPGSPGRHADPPGQSRASAAAAVELALVLGGAWLYWRASRSVSLREGRSPARAITVSLLIAGCGALVLGLDFFS